MNELATHIKCKCGFDNEILFLFEEGFECMVCGLHIIKTKELKQHAKNTIKFLLSNPDKFKSKYKDKLQAQKDIDNLIKLNNQIKMWIIWYWLQLTTVMTALEYLVVK